MKQHPENKNRDNIVIHSQSNNNDIDQYLYNIYWDVKYSLPCLVICEDDLNEDALADYNDSFGREKYLPVLYFCEKDKP